MSTPTSAERTRSKLLTAAAEEILAHGFAGASMARIAERVGLTKGALSHHFPAKDTLITAAVAHVDHLAPAVAAGAAGMFPDSPIRACVAVMGGVAAASMADPVLGAALRMFQDPSVPAEKLEALQHTMEQLFEPCLHGAATQERYVLTMESQDAARFLVIVLMGFLSARRFRSMLQLRHEEMFVGAALVGIGITDGPAVVRDVLTQLLPA